MIDCEVLKFGDFVTKSGRNTPFFVNTGFYRTGSQLRSLGADNRQRLLNRSSRRRNILNNHNPIAVPYGAPQKNSLIAVILDLLAVGAVADVALQEIQEKYGLKTTAIVTMAEVVEHLHNRPYKGKVIIDDTLKEAIDAYYLK